LEASRSTKRSLGRRATRSWPAVLRGIAGYGRSTHIHEVFHGFSYDLPVVVEVIDTAEKIDGWLGTLEGLRQGALVMRQTVQILQSSEPAANLA
jgi:uncharacterized protein